MSGERHRTDFEAMTTAGGTTGDDVDDLWSAETFDGDDGSHVAITKGQKSVRALGDELYVCQGSYH